MDAEPDTMREDIEKSWDEQLKEWVKSKLPGNKRKKKIGNIMDQDPTSPQPKPEGE